MNKEHNEEIFCSNHTTYVPFAISSNSNKRPFCIYVRNTTSTTFLHLCELLQWLQHILKVDTFVQWVKRLEGNLGKDFYYSKTMHDDTYHEIPDSEWISRCAD